MPRRVRGHMASVFAAIFACLVYPAAAQSPAPGIGMVIMHGKGGSPTRYVAELAAYLENQGYLVANLDMPWSGQRNYYADVAAAEQQVTTALDGLRAKGAAKLFVAGHSQGGLFALYFGGRHPVDGIVAIAPGGSAASIIVREKLGATLARARELAAGGKGGERMQFLDFEASKGTYPVVTAAVNYLGWFEPDGAMNQALAMKNVNPKVPVLYIAPKGDYPGLHKIRQSMFAALPRHPLSKLHEPEATHLGAPSAALDEILRWTREAAQ